MQLPKVLRLCVNPLARLPHWIATSVGLRDRDVPDKLVIPWIVPVLPVLDVAPAAFSDELTTTLRARLPDVAGIGAVIQADPANGDDVLLGIGRLAPGTLPFHTLIPGAFFAADVANLNLFTVESGGAGAVRVTFTMLQTA
jgi:hypothetical protein